MSLSIAAKKSSGLSGDIFVDGDKSISYQAIMISAISNGPVRINGLLESRDVLRTMTIMRQCGVRIDHTKTHSIVYGVGFQGLKAPNETLYVGNSATSASLLSGIFAASDLAVFMYGDESMSTRSMGPIIDPLSEMGARIVARNERLPMAIFGAGDDISPITYEITTPSSEVKSAILLAALRAPGITRIIESGTTKNHTEIMLKNFGIKISTNIDGDKRIIEIGGADLLFHDEISIPGDPSSAAFIVAAAILIPHSVVRINEICMSNGRSAFYDVIKKMGANISFVNYKLIHGEVVADIIAEYSRESLVGLYIATHIMSGMIDEYPIFCVIASFAAGETTLSNVGRLKSKESHHFDGIISMLKARNVDMFYDGNDIVIYGNPDLQSKSINYANVYGDERIAMSNIIMGMCLDGVFVQNAECIYTSFPNFVKTLQHLGGMVFNIV